MVTHFLFVFNFLFILFSCCSTTNLFNFNFNPVLLSNSPIDKKCIKTLLDEFPSYSSKTVIESNGSCTPSRESCYQGVQCLLKAKLCDGIQNCLHNSDEKYCNKHSPFHLCDLNEFFCDSKCIPKGKLCDGKKDCMDGSDEKECAAPSALAKRNNLTVCEGATVNMKCHALGFPTPFINWRKNCGYICEEQRCLIQDWNLKIENAQKSDSGVYICEAVNKLGTAFAIATTLEVVKCNEYRLEKILADSVRGCYYDLARLPNGDLVSVGTYREIKIWNTTSNEIKKIIHSGHKQNIMKMAMYPDGTLVTSSHDSTIKLWSSTSELIATLHNHTNAVMSLAILPNGYLASGSDDNSIIIWDREKGTIFTRMGHTPGHVRSLAVLKNGLLACGTTKGAIIVFDVINLKFMTAWAANIKNVHINMLVVLENGDLVSASDDHTLKIWNPNDGSLKMKLEGHTDEIWALAILPNGDIVSGAKDGQIRIWNTDTGALKTTLKGAGIVTSITVLSNDRFAASFENVNQIYIWLKTKEPEKSKVIQKDISQLF